MLTFIYFYLEIQTINPHFFTIVCDNDLLLQEYDDEDKGRFNIYYFKTKDTQKGKRQNIFRFNKHQYFCGKNK